MCQRLTEEPVLQSIISVKVVQKSWGPILILIQGLKDRSLELEVMLMLVGKLKETSIIKIIRRISASNIKELTKINFKTFLQILKRQNHT
jgi:hypothetical protein